MSALFDRDLLAQIVIILSICFGGWWIFVQPAAREVQALETEIVQMQQEAIASASAGPLQMAADELLAINRHFNAMLDRNAVARDASGLYALIKDLAAEHGVTLHLLQPDDRRVDEDDETTIVQVRLVLEGRYESLARFLDAVEAYPAFFRVTQLKLESRDVDRATSISATVHVEALSFTYDAALEALAKGKN